MNRSRTINLILLVAVVALFAVPLALRLNAGDLPAAESYAGTDSSAQSAIAEIDPGYRRWATPLFQPSSGQIESGLFAVQAALGAGAMGFVLGRLAERRHQAGDRTVPVTRTTSAEPV